MHYKNGREAKLGDRVVGRDSYNNLVTGTVVQIMPGATSCNALIRGTQVIPTTPNCFGTGSNQFVTDADGKAHYVIDQNQHLTCADLIHAEDALVEVEKAIAAAIPPTPAPAVLPAAVS